MMTLHGVSRPESFEANLEDRHFNAETGMDEAIFAAKGSVKRSDYHMECETGFFIDNRVTFTIQARLQLSPAKPVEVVSSARVP
jgi:polyisoprenoid-binding protein YceI